MRHNVSEIQNKVQNNTDDIARLRTAIDRIDKKGAQGPHAIDRQPAGEPHRTIANGPRLEMGRPAPTFLTGASCEAQDLIRRDKYEEALRSIRIWPIQGDTQEQMRSGFEDFLTNCLLLTPTEVGNLGIERITRQRNQPGQRIHDEIRVVMARQSSREHVGSKGRMLAEYVDAENRPTAGIRISWQQTLKHWTNMA